MDTESINSLLKYFPYTEAEKTQVRELLIKRDPALMAALSSFLSTRDVTALNRDFKSILSQQQGGSYKTTTHVSAQAPVKEVFYTSPNVSKGYETSTTYTVGGVAGVSGGNYSASTTQYGVSTVPGGASQSYSVQQKTYSSPSSGLNVPSTTQVVVQKSAVSFVSPSKDQDLKDGPDPRDNKHLTESQQKTRQEVGFSIQRLKRLSDAAALKKKEVGEQQQGANFLKTLEFDFLPDQIVNNYIDVKCKEKLIETSKTLSFENFLDIRHFLRLDKIELSSFIEKANARVLELHPRKPNQDESTYNPGFSLEEFIGLLCGDSEIPKNKMGYIGLLFYYMDYNHNQILEIDEILQGFIMLGPGDKKDKITAAFKALGGRYLVMNETQLAHYFEIVIRVYKLKEDLGSGEKIDLYDIQQDIDLAAKSLSHKIFEIVDYDESGLISLEEFLIWFDTIQGKSNWFELKSNPEFKKALGLAKESKKKRIDQLTYATDPQTQVSTKEKFKSDILANNLHTKQLETLKKTLKVDLIDVSTAVEVFNSMKYSNALTVKEFEQFFKMVYKKENINLTSEEAKNVDKEIVRFFQILDTNKNGVLEWDELMSAIIFVLRGSQSQKTRIAFEIFDTDKSESLQFKELFFFLKGIFNLLMYDNPHELFKKESPDAIAFATAKECFLQYKLDLEKGAVDYQQFQKWYSSNL